MKRFSIYFILALLVVGGALPAHAAAVTSASTFEVSGWLPYWKAASSSADVLPHLNQLTEINPFGYTVKNDGTLYDEANLNSATSSYAQVIAAARAQHVLVIPTIMWSNTNAIDTVLSSTTLRAQNVASIATMVKQNNFDGADIDYEGKKASDINYFSSFLQQLSVALKQEGNNKQLDCTIEARTPPADLNTNTPVSQILYANDLTAINTYCDRVQIMTYDQESADKTLNEAAGNSLYTPVADPKWVTAVIQLMEKSIAPSKIQMGIATYGYEYQVVSYANGGGYFYDLLWAFNPKYATQIASALHITPQRDSAGELAFTYLPTSTPAVLPGGTSSATATNPSTLSAAVSSAFGQTAYAAETQSVSGPFRYVTWSDAGAIAQKIALAKQLGIGGVAIFKLDGGEDQSMWSYLPVINK